jgi:cytochrome P450
MDLLETYGDPAFQSDPHPYFARWRHAAAIHRGSLPDGSVLWQVNRYDLARAALSDPRLSKVEKAPSVLSLDEWEAISRHMLSTDPPDHTRLRKLVQAAFTMRRIEALRPRIEEIAAELVEGLRGRETADLMDDFAFPLPMRVICELLGVDPADRDRFKHWAAVAVGGPAAAPELPGVVRDIIAYADRVVPQRREQPGDDLLSGLIAAGDEGDRLTGAELSSMIFLLLVAGHETTVNLIGNGARLMLRRRELWDRLRADPALIPGAVEEFLRFESPVQVSSYRIATEELELGGETIRAGEVVLIALLSANRDEERFTEPAELRIERENNPHLAFGHGLHYCLGAPLARLEARIAFSSLLAAFPEMTISVGDEELEPRPSLVIRGLRHLPVRPEPPHPGLAEPRTTP